MTKYWKELIVLAEMPSIKWQVRMGQRDARDGLTPILNTPTYLNAYARQYELGEIESSIDPIDPDEVDYEF